MRTQPRIGRVVMPATASTGRGGWEERPNVVAAAVLPVVGLNWERRESRRRQKGRTRRQTERKKGEAC